METNGFKPVGSPTSEDGQIVSTWCQYCNAINRMANTLTPTMNIDWPMGLMLITTIGQIIQLMPTTTIDRPIQLMPSTNIDRPMQ